MKFVLRWTWAGFLFGCGGWAGWYFGQACYWFGGWLRMSGIWGML